MLDDLVLGAALALAVSFIVCRALIGAGPVDLPSEARKRHASPTPTSGGIGVALGFAVGLIMLATFSAAWRYEVTTIGSSLLTVGVSLAYGFLLLGFIDDAHPLGPRLKFVVFSALSFGAALTVGVVQALPLGGDVLHVGFLIGLLGTALWVFTLVNCVNFMDGANGLAMGSLAIGLTTLGALAMMRASPSGAAIAFCAAGALVGFLFWNYPRARLFAGDSGALFAGALAAIASLIIIRRTGLSPWIPPIVFFPILADALLTLAWRAGRGRSLFQGHAEHLYQIAMRAQWGHARIALAYWVAAAACGGLAFVLARSDHTIWPWVGLVALSGVAVVISALVRAAAKRRGIDEAQ